MRANLEGRSKFNHFRAHHFQEAGRLLSKAGFQDWETISRLDEQTRKYLREDLRKEGVAAVQLSIVTEISHHYENEKPPKTDSPDEEPLRRLNLKSWLPQLRCDDDPLT